MLLRSPYSGILNFWMAKQRTPVMVLYNTSARGASISRGRWLIFVVEWKKAVELARRSFSESNFRHSNRISKGMSYFGALHTMMPHLEKYYSRRFAGLILRKVMALRDNVVSQ